VASEMFGPYRLDGLLGQGGMGRVFRAFDTELARPVALKVLTADLSADRHEPVDLPLTNETIAAVADFKAKFRTGDNVAAKA